MREYCVLRKNVELNELGSLIGEHYESDYDDSLGESTLADILNRIASLEVKAKIKEIWYDLCDKLNYEIFMLHNLTSGRGSLPEGDSFILKIRPEVGRQISEGIYKSTGVQLDVLSVDACT